MSGGWKKKCRPGPIDLQPVYAVGFKKKTLIFAFRLFMILTCINPSRQEKQYRSLRTNEIDPDVKFSIG